MDFELCNPINLNLTQPTRESIGVYKNEVVLSLDWVPQVKGQVDCFSIQVRLGLVINSTNLPKLQP